ncbi:MAG: hypothetical protein WA117_05960 [Verrucomicrobiia bacterium]
MRDWSFWEKRRKEPRFWGGSDPGPLLLVPVHAILEAYDVLGQPTNAIASRIGDLRTTPLVQLPLQDAIHVHKEFGFAWSLPDLKQQDDMKAVVRECIADHRNFGDHELDVFRILADDKKQMVYLAFEADGAPDLMVVYAYDLRKKRLVFKFYMPMA